MKIPFYNRVFLAFLGLVITPLSLVFAQGVPMYPHEVGSSLEIHIDDKGNVKLEGAYVQQLAGTSLYTQLAWDGAKIRFIIKTDPKTTVTRRFGGFSSVSEIAMGHFISVEGTLQTGTDSLIVNASTIKDWSLNTDQGQFSGTVSGLASSGTGFTLFTKDKKSISVTFSTTSSQITKGALTLQPKDIQIGDTVLGVTGVYDYLSTSLVAKTVQIYQDKSIFTPRNFQGTLKEMNGTTLPTSLTITAEGKDYTVNLSGNATVLNAKRNAVRLERFLIGDTIRFYGSIQQNNLGTVDADIIRNISL